MWETLLVLVAIVALGLFGVFIEALSPTLLIGFGLWGLGIGLGIGLPAGFLYHYRLYQALERNGTVPAGWWLSPSDFHDALPAVHFARIKPWYVLGGLSFALALAGGLSTFAGLLMLR